MKDTPIRFGLAGRLLILLIAVGAVPLALSIALGYRVSRSLLQDQAGRALIELAERQALQVSKELSRQRLLLRAVAGHVDRIGLSGEPAADVLAEALVTHLPESRVFDGLRVVDDGGRVVSSSALRGAPPEWPSRVPAAEWDHTAIAVHREGPHRVIAYLIAARVEVAGRPMWLEGHVRAEDVPELFSIPEHMMGGVESVVFDDRGGLLLAGHSHASEALLSVRAELAPIVELPPPPESLTEDDARHGPDGAPAADLAAVVRARSLGHELDVLGDPYIAASGTVPGARWVYLVAMPLHVALAPLARLRNAAVAATGALVLLILFTALAAERFIGAPLRNLAAAAVRFGRGEGYVPVPRRSRDEIGLLAGAFNRMAEDLERSRREIEQLHDRELERAQQLATVGEMASGIAHEIRNPVAGIRGALELVVRDLSAEGGARELLREAASQLGRIERTTSDLLRFARPPELREVATDARELVEESLRLTAPQAKAAGATVRMVAEDRPYGIRVDPEMVVQVLVNLILNGIQAAGNGGTVEVRLIRDDRGVNITVADDGPGVPEKLRRDVFRPFFTTKHRGSGLGLSISRQIAERHGGGLELADVGGGATFVFTLPTEGGPTE